MNVHNLASSLRGRRCNRSMDRYDALPPALRAWLARAALPWSAHSALKLWTRLCRDGAENAEAIHQQLDRIEARLLVRDAPKIWGPGYPAG